MLKKIDHTDPVAAIVNARKTPIHTLAILGSHPQTVETAPFHDEGVLIFSCSPHNVEMRTLPRWDMWSEIHLPAIHPTRSYDYIRRLESQAQAKADRGENPVVWMRDKSVVQHMPGGILYPEPEMKAKFCPFLFTSSIAFMLALSIDIAEKHNIGTIGLWGILQSSKPEYINQRPGCQYLLWEATKRNIKVLAARESNLFEMPLEDF
jgi:hypothetical protein